MSAPPKILMVDLSLWFGGSNARVLGLLQALPKSCGAIAVLHGSEVMAEAEKLGIEVHVVGRHKLDPSIRRNLRLLITESGFQVLDAQNPQSKFWASLAARGTGCALVSTLNSWYEKEYNGNFRGRLYQSLERWSTRRTDMFIVVSEEIRQQLLTSGSSPDAIALIPNAVSVATESLTGDGAWLRQEFGLPEGAIVCAALGRLVWAKGYLHLIQAVALSKHSHLHAIIVGEGRDRADLEAAVAKAGLGSRIVFAGYREHHEALNIVQAADLFLMPSLSEGTPISLLEAGALGKPIIASRTGGIPTLVDDGVHAKLVEPGDDQALAKAMDQLIDSPAIAQELSKNVAAHVHSSFSTTQQAQQTLTAYDHALQRARQRNDKAKA